MSGKVQQSSLELVSAEKSACPLCESTMFSDSRAIFCATREPTVGRGLKCSLLGQAVRNRTLPQREDAQT